MRKNAKIIPWVFWGRKANKLHLLANFRPFIFGVNTQAEDDLQGVKTFDHDGLTLIAKGEKSPWGQLLRTKARAESKAYKGISLRTLRSAKGHVKVQGITAYLVISFKP